MIQMKLKICGFLLSTLLGLGTAAFAEDYADTILRLSPDAVSRSIGGPNQAFSLGAVDIFINPALMGSHSGRELQFSSIVQSDFLEYVNGALSIPMSNNDQFGMGMIWANIPDIQEYGLQGINANENDNFQFALFAGYARRFKPFAIGASLKYLQLGFSFNEPVNTLNAFGLDLGLYYALGTQLSFGATFQNAVSLSWGKQAGSTIPQQMGVSIAYTPELFAKDFLRLLSGIKKLENRPLQLNVGAIATLFSGKTTLHDLNVRAGYGNVDLTQQKYTDEFEQLTEWERDYRVGAGLHLAIGDKIDLGLDYCFQIQEELDNQHIITTKLSF